MKTERKAKGKWDVERNKKIEKIIKIIGKKKIKIKRT